jgi:hypothetical protein
MLAIERVSEWGSKEIWKNGRRDPDSPVPELGLDRPGPGRFKMKSLWIAR